MGHFEEFFIDRSEGWKYQTTLENTNGVRARVWVDDDGNISKDSYSRQYNEKIGNVDKSKDSEKESKESKKSKASKNKDTEKEKESCLTRIIKAPFRFLWWLIKFILKNALVILTFGIANGWFDKKE